MIKISPSILASDFANLESEIRRIETADYVHVDVMDGLFVPNITIGIPVVASIRKKTNMLLDVHLMIDRPVRYVEEFCTTRFAEPRDSRRLPTTSEVWISRLPLLPVLLMLSLLWTRLQAARQIGPSLKSWDVPAVV